MINRILCPFHQERTPSCVVYQTGYRCYGCGKQGPLSDLGLTPDKVEVISQYVENVQDSIKTIRRLPIRPTRGLSFHCDADFYYVLWPNADYYNRRCFSGDVSHGQKYKCPAGVPKPLFQAYVHGHSVGMVVEGEINALSIASCNPPCDVYCPGGAGDFYGKRVQKDLTIYSKYDRIILVADADKAGAIACIELKSRLTAHVTDVDIFLMSKDANDILVQDGQKTLDETIRSMVVSRKLPDISSPVQASRGSTA